MWIGDWKQSLIYVQNSKLEAQETEITDFRANRRYPNKRITTREKKLVFMLFTTTTKKRRPITTRLKRFIGPLYKW